MNVATVNVRYSRGRDGRHGWTCRRPLLLARLASLDADLFGFQEVLPDQRVDLMTSLEGYQGVGVGRDDGIEAGESASLFSRRERFDLLGGGNFWLSDTPDRPGRGWDAACTRICTWARLRARATGRLLLAANTHFDHDGQLARLNSARLLRQKLPALAEGAAIILTGDFNCTEDSEAYRVLTRPGADDQWIDAYRTVHPHRSEDEATCHEFTGRTRGSRIDWILHTPHLLPTHAGIDRTRSPADLYPSDHYPVWATLEWRAAAAPA